MGSEGEAVSAQDKALGRGVEGRVWNKPNNPGIEAETGPQRSSGYLLGLLATIRSQIVGDGSGGGGRPCLVYISAVKEATLPVC